MQSLSVLNVESGTTVAQTPVPATTLTGDTLTGYTLAGDLGAVSIRLYTEALQYGQGATAALPLHAGRYGVVV